MLDVSIIIPVYKDASHIEATVRSILSHFSACQTDVELILVHDGGPEETRTVLHTLASTDSFVRLVDRRENRGKGYSVREGLSVAAGNILVYTDADLPYALTSMQALIDSVKNNETDLALASRHVHGANDVEDHQSILRHVSHTLFAWIVNVLLDIPCSDTQAGLKAMTRTAAEAILPHLTIDRYCFDVELLFVAQRLGYRLKEIPVRLRTKGASNIHLSKDSWEMLRDLLRLWKRRHRL